MLTWADEIVHAKHWLGCEVDLETHSCWDEGRYLYWIFARAALLTFYWILSNVGLRVGVWYVRCWAVLRGEGPLITSACQLVMQGRVLCHWIILLNGLRFWIYVRSLNGFLVVHLVEVLDALEVFFDFLIKIRWYRLMNSWVNFVGVPITVTIVDLLKIWFGGVWWWMVGFRLDG